MRGHDTIKTIFDPLAERDQIKLKKGRGKKMYQLWINPNEKKSKIHKEIYGHFSEHLGRCIYEGIYVGEDSSIPNEKGMRSDVVNALKELDIPVLRWPGGCFADEYHWKDGIGEKSKRKRMVNTHWGGVVEDNSFGTHEFLELCQQIGAQPYINGNLGSGTVQEMSEWVEYMTFDGVSPMADLRRENGREQPWKIKYFGVGNENWGCGGCMTPEYYANEYRRYQTYCRNYGENKLYKIACGPSEGDYHWMEELMKTAGQFMDGISLHYYTVPDTWQKKGAATGFDQETWYRTLKKTLYMEELLTKHSAIMDQYDPKKRVGLIVDEWGTWFDVEEGTNPGFLYQQNTMRDALVAGINLNLFNKHSDRVRMANIAQLVNVLQSVILTEGERMVKTPTYYVFRMFKKHMEGELLHSALMTEEIGPEAWRVPNVTESASMDGDGNIVITLNNLSAEDACQVEVHLNEHPMGEIEGEILTGAFTDYNTFDQPDNVKTETYTDYEVRDGKLILNLPASSVLCVTIKA